jgi:hypothetical protein
MGKKNRKSVPPWQVWVGENPRSMDEEGGKCIPVKIKDKKRSR